MRKFTFGLLALCQACTATDTGNPADDRDNTGQTTEGEDGRCDRSETELTDLNAVTSVGFSAQALLDLVTGEHTEALAWQGDSSTYGPVSGTSGIVLTVEPLGAVQLVDREVSPPEPGTFQGEIDIVSSDYNCADLLELDVRLHIRTDGGALDETVEVTLQASSPDYASLRVELPTDTLTGSFQTDTVIPDNYELTKGPILVINAGISPYGSVGEFGLYSEFQSTGDSGFSVSQGGIGVLAQFPAEDFCGLGSVNVQADQELRGLSVSKVLDSLNSVSPVTLNGVEPVVTLALDFESDADSVCVRVDAPATANATLEFPGTVTLLASDGRAEGSIVVNMTAETSDSELIRASARGGLSLQADAAGAAARRGEFAIAEELDFSGFEGGGFEFRTENLGSSFSGSLKAFGLIQPDCSTPEPNPDEEEEVSTPGCAGTQATDIWSASWGQRP